MEVTRVRPPGNVAVAEHERFVGEPIRPIVETIDASRMAIGEPGLPREFVWRGRTARIATVVRTWREAGPCRHGSGERYVRKHWFEVVTSAGETMKLYFERQPRGGIRRAGWRLFSIREVEGPPDARTAGSDEHD